MKNYLIQETLTDNTGIKNVDPSFARVTILNSEEWLKRREHFDPEQDIANDFLEQYITRAEVNYDSLTGSFSIPDRNDLNGDDHGFSFFLNEHGVIFIDDDRYVAGIIDTIAKNRKWHDPCIERFLYDFIDQLIKDDLRLMEKYEIELDTMEDDLLSKEKMDSLRLNEIRGQLRMLMVHYDQLLDVTQEFEENENGFFKEENVHYFHKIESRIERLYNNVSSINDYAIQLRDLYSQQIDIRMNRVMTILTVLSTIFMPLTLIAGWYGMNFHYMPEFSYRYSYPILIVVCIIIVGSMLYYFKKKKWL
ncbi:MAG: hypothetical protein IKO38_01935 [Erysipelotrichaceae bacterium]|nr:hypothetical protein [Erysipelotrichaceae bacterium]